MAARYCINFAAGGASGLTLAMLFYIWDMVDSVGSGV